MSFYDLSKEERVAKVGEIEFQLQEALLSDNNQIVINYYSDDDIYIRKTAYLAVGRIYNRLPPLRKSVLKVLNKNFLSENELVRQTVVNTAGEIGMFQFEKVITLFDKALLDPHHKVRNAVIGSLKKMSQKNPVPTLQWAKHYLIHQETEIRRQVCHGIELRGRTHPEDILPLLKVLQFEKTKRVRSTLIHVLGQISYKKNCLRKVVTELGLWDNKDLIKDAIHEIVDVHSDSRYGKFSAFSQEEAIKIISKELNELEL